MNRTLNFICFDILFDSQKGSLFEISRQLLLEALVLIFFKDVDF